MGVNEPKRAFSCKVILQLEVKARDTDTHIMYVIFSLVYIDSMLYVILPHISLPAGLLNHTKTLQEWMYTA